MTFWEWYFIVVYVVGFILVFTPLPFSLYYAFKQERRRLPASDWFILILFWLCSITFVWILFVCGVIDIVNQFRRRTTVYVHTTTHTMTDQIVNLPTNEPPMPKPQHNNTVEVSSDAVALAKAVLAGDATAAAILADWVQENNANPVGRFSVAYVNELEDSLIEIQRLVFVEGFDWRINQCVLEEATVDRIYHLCYKAKQHAVRVDRPQW